MLFTGGAGAETERRLLGTRLRPARSRPALRIQFAKRPELRTQEAELCAQSAELAVEAFATELKDFTVDETTAGALFDKATEIAMGLTAEPFTVEEQRAALTIRTAAAGLDRDDPVAVRAKC